VKVEMQGEPAAEAEEEEEEGGAPLEASLTFSDFDKSLTIIAPPADEVAHLTQ
jgi:hypothetical protein